MVVLLLGLSWVVGCVLQSGFSVVDRPRGGLSVILSPRTAAWSAATGAVGRGQSDGTTSPEVGVMTCTTRVRPRYRERSCASPVQAADMPVTQPVEDQSDQLAGGCDDTDVVPAVDADLVADLPQPVMSRIGHSRRLIQAAGRTVARLRRLWCPRRLRVVGGSRCGGFSRSLGSRSFVRFSTGFC